MSQMALNFKCCRSLLSLPSKVGWFTNAVCWWGSSAHINASFDVFACGSVTLVKKVDSGADQKLTIVEAYQEKCKVNRRVFNLHHLSRNVSFSCWLYIVIYSDYYPFSLWTAKWIVSDFVETRVTKIQKYHTVLHGSSVHCGVTAIIGCTPKMSYHSISCFSCIFLKGRVWARL